MGIHAEDAIEREMFVGIEHSFIDAKNIFREHRAQNEFKWLTIEKKELRISEMKTGHIMNCIAMLLRSDIEYSDSLAYKGLVDELNRRVK